MKQPDQQRATSRPGLRGWLMRAVAHSLGVAAMAVVMLVPFVNRVSLEAVWQSAHYADFIGLSWQEAALHLGLAVCLWTLLVLGFEIVTSRRQPVKKVLELERGSVMTETIIVLPIFFLLTFGIAQLAVNNIAGLLCNAAVFQAGRTAWLWQPEADVNRRGVTAGKVKELARVQAAAVLAPVAPGDFEQTPIGGSTEFREMRGLLLASQMPAFSTDTGQVGMAAAGPLVAGSLGRTVIQDSSFTSALDDSGFRSRTARKFTFAYAATKVNVIQTGSETGASLEYHQSLAFPFIARFMGKFDTVGGRPGFYLTIKRRFTMPNQIPPNPRWN